MDYLGTLVATSNRVTKYSELAGAGVSSVSAIGAVPNANGATITGTVINLQPANASFGGVLTNTSQIIGGLKTFNSTSIFDYGFVTGAGGIAFDASLYAGNGPNANRFSLAEVQVLSQDVCIRVLERNGTVDIIGADASYVTHIFGTRYLTEATTGTHALFSQLAIKPLSIGNDTAVTTNAATIYIEGPAIGTATITNNYSLWIDSGSLRFDGALLPNNQSGTSGQVLTSAGAGAVPTWTTVGSGGVSGTTSLTTQTFTATASQTVFTIAGGYTVGSIEVYYDGSHLSPSEYVATNGTTVTLVTPANLNDIIDVNIFTSISSPTKTFGTLTFAATTNWDYSTGFNKLLTLTGASTLAITNDNDGDYGTLLVTQDATGGRVLTLPAGDNTTGIAAQTVASSKVIYSYVKVGSIRYWNSTNR